MPKALDVTCPKCLAQAQEPCVDNPYPHLARIRALQKDFQED